MNETRIHGWMAGCLLLVSAMLIPVRPAAAAEGAAISVVLPLTGGASFLGKAERRTLEIVEEMVNEGGGIGGRTLHFAFSDDQSQPQTAVQLAAGLVARHPPVVLGSAVVAMCNAMAPLMRDGPVMYCFSPGIHPPPGSYVFTSNISTVDLASTLIRFYRLKGWTRLALITSTDASGQDAERGIQSVLARPENRGVRLVADEQFTPTDVSVAAQIERIRAAQPQALIAWSTGGPIGTVFKGLVQGGVTLPVGTTNGNMTLAQMRQYADFLPKELYIPSSEWPRHGAALTLPPAVETAQAQFFAAYEKAGIEPDVAASLSWDPALIVVQALRALGPQATAAQVKAYIAGLKGFGGINGVYDFTALPQRGLDEQDAVVTRWNAARKSWDVVSRPTGVPLAK